jgi:hypothetical protein
MIGSHVPYDADKSAFKTDFQIFFLRGTLSGARSFGCHDASDFVIAGWLGPVRWRIGRARTLGGRWLAAHEQKTAPSALFRPVGLR